MAELQKTHQLQPSYTLILLYFEKSLIKIQAWKWCQFPQLVVNFLRGTEKWHWTLRMTCDMWMTRHVLLSKVFHGVGRRLIKVTTPQCILSILTYFFPSSLTLTATNKTKQVWKNKESWILSLLWLHHLFLRWEMVERRVRCLSSDMSYTQLWTLWASREKQVF